MPIESKRPKFQRSRCTEIASVPSSSKVLSLTVVHGGADHTASESGPKKSHLICNGRRGVGIGAEHILREEYSTVLSVA